MNLPNLLQYGAFLLVVILLVKPLGGYMARVFTGERTFLDFLLRPLERLIYRLTGLTTNDGAHGFTEILYAYTSAVANNGQNFAGLSVDSPFYHATLTIAMMVGRFALAIPALALAGHFARQGRRTVTLGTLPTDSFEFGILLVGTALIVGGLSYFPALALGPVIEHFLMRG